jgi:hypothetical protein
LAGRQLGAAGVGAAVKNILTPPEKTRPNFKNPYHPSHRRTNGFEGKIPIITAI